MNIEVVHSGTEGFGQVSITTNFTQEEWDFVNTQYPREGFFERVFLERIVEKFNPSGFELVHGWMRLMDEAKRKHTE